MLEKTVECREDEHDYEFFCREINVDTNHHDITIYRCTKCGKEKIVWENDTTEEKG